MSASSYVFEGHASFATSGVIAAIVAAGSDSAALFAAGKSIVDFIHATTFAEAVIKAGKSSGVSARLALLGSLGEKLMSIAAAHHYCPLVVIRVCEAFEVLSSTNAATQNAPPLPPPLPLLLPFPPPPPIPHPSSISRALGKT